MTVAASVCDIREALAGKAVLDIGCGLAAAQVTKFLAELGAAVTRFEPVAGDPFAAYYPAYRVWHGAAATQLVVAPSDPRVMAAAASADICVLGGENFPGYDWFVDPDTLLACNPGLVILVIEAAPPNHPDHGKPATELLAQARSGLASELSERGPVHLAFAPAGQGAALLGLTALFASLCRRARGGAGEIVRTSLYEGALTLAPSHWMRAARPSGGFNFAIPKDPSPLIFCCRDGRYVQIVLGSAGSKGALYGILRIDDPSVRPEDSGMPTGRGEPKNFFGDVDLLARHVALFDSAPLLAALNQAGIACSPVLAPGECWNDPQVDYLGLIKTGQDGTAHVGLPLRGVLRRAAVAPPIAAAPLAAPSPGAPPLAGVRVLDFGIFVAGPYGGVALADLGADVIKIETPQGDPNRNIYRSYAAVNRGKRAITLDLKTPEGQAIARRLIASSHLVMSNFRPGVSRRLGIDPATLHATDPDLVVIETTGFGRGGPHGDRPGFDMIFQAFCGHDIRAGGTGNPPYWDRTSMVDYVLGLIEQVGMLIGLWWRLHGGGGADLELALLDAGLLLMSELLRLPDGSFAGAPINNATRTGFHPAEAFYQCSDGWIAVAARGPIQAAALAATLGLTLGPVAGWSEAAGISIAAALVAQDRAGALARLLAAGIWATRCVESGEVALFDPDRTPADLVAVSESQVYGQVSQIGGLFSLGDGRHTAPRGAPGAGEHTASILEELGIVGSERDDLFARRIVA